MSGPFILMSKSAIKPGKAEEYQVWAEKFVRLVDENEPRILAFNMYTDENGTRAIVIQVHPDAESMEYHLKVLGEKVGESFEFLDSTTVEVFGTPSEALRQGLGHIKDVPVTVTPGHQGGLTRLQAG